MTPAETLAGDLTGWLDKSADGARRRVLLWLDPASEFAGLAPGAEAALAALDVRLLTVADRRRQLAVKLELLRLEGRSPGAAAGSEAGSEGPTRIAVYLPGFERADLEPRSGAPPVLWSVVEYRYKGAVWGIGKIWQPEELPEPPTLLAWLQAHGLRLADASAAGTLTAGGAESLLARYTLKYPDRAMGDHNGRLRISDVRGALGGDPRDELRRLIRDPDKTVAAWGKDAAVVLEGLRETFGLAAEPDGNPSDYADEAVILLALAEAWEAFGEASDFPYVSRLPASVKQRQALSTALRDDILASDALRRAYRERIGRLEGQYDLSGWALDREGWPAGLPGLAGRQWQRLLLDLDHEMEGGWRAGRAFLLAHAQRVASGLQSPWNGEGDGRPWGALSDLLALCREAEAAIDASEAMQRAAEMVDAYAGSWFRIDGLHLRVREVCSQEPDLEHAREIVDGAYAEYVAGVNERFSSLVETEGTWPPAGTAGVEGVREQVWGSGGERTAVIISDALRWDLGRQVLEQMGDGATATAVISTLPSITPFGMTAMLPLREGEPVVRWSGGPTIKDGSGRSLAERPGRKALIEDVCQARGQEAGFVEMNALLRSRKAPAGDVVVVFDTNIDAQGHKAVENFPALAQKLVTDIRRSIEKLHSFGFPVVHVLTDHGFLLLSPEHVDALGRPDMPLALCVKREARWAALKPDAPADGSIRLPAPLAPEAGTLAFPRGVRTFVAAEPYSHGGISLQECVIPHIVSVAPTLTGRVRPLLAVSQTVLTTATVPFSLQAAAADETSPGTMPPRRVRLVSNPRLTRRHTWPKRRVAAAHSP